MDPILMAGAWAGAILSITVLARLGWKAFVTAVESVIESAIKRIWTDMDHIEARLDRLEQQVNELREQMRRMSDLLLAHVAEMTRRHDE